jgi:capsular exopolysaccharide synthesis family protein
LEVAAYLRILAKYWWVVVACIVLGAGIGFGNAVLRTKEYRSAATLLASAMPGSTVTEAYQNGIFAQDRANTYSSLAASEQVAARAVSKLELPMSVADLRSKITSATVPGTLLFTIAVTDVDPVKAQTYANAVIDELVETVNELESRGTDKAVAGVLVVNPPSYPISAQGLGKHLRIILGAVGGLLVGLLGAILVGVLDRRVRGREEVEAVTGSFVLGALPNDGDRPRRGAVDLGAGGTYVERLRALRTNLCFMALVGADWPVKVLAVTSPSANAGRTTLAVDLAVALAETGRPVILVEGDLRHPVLAERLDLSGDAQARGLGGVLAGDYPFEDAVISALPVGDLSIDCLPAGPASQSPGQLWSTDEAASFVQFLHNKYDYAVIDTPALDEYNDGAAIAVLADGALLVARIRRSSSTALRRALRTLRSAKIDLIGTVVTGERTRWGSFVSPHRTAASTGGAGGAEDVPVAEPKVKATVGRHHAVPERS